MGGTPWVLTITGPGRAEASIADHDDGAYTIRYICSTSGRYRLAVRLGEQHLTGSPFEIVVKGLPTSSALGFAVVEASLGVAASARHSVRGLWNRWRAYMPLATLWATRNRGLMVAGTEHAVRNALEKAFFELRQLAEYSDAGPLASASGASTFSTAVVRSLSITGGASPTHGWGRRSRCSWRVELWSRRQLRLRLPSGNIALRRTS